MAQSLARLWTHLIFSTKEPYPFLSDPTVRADMHAYIGTVLRTHDCLTLVIGGTEDHVFSVSQSHVAQVRNYILRQEQHHRRKTFQDEFRAFLRKYEIKFDERFLWD